LFIWEDEDVDLWITLDLPFEESDAIKWCLLGGDDDDAIHIVPQAREVVNLIRIFLPQVRRGCDWDGDKPFDLLITLIDLELDEKDDKLWWKDDAYWTYYWIDGM